LLRRLLRPLLDPYRRYRHARVIHAVRVSLGLLATILLTTGINLPHGEWASVTAWCWWHNRPGSGCPG